MKVRFSGITCDACIRLITLKVLRIEGIQNIDIDKSTGDAIIQAVKPVTVAVIAEALKNTPYDVVVAA